MAVVGAAIAAISGAFAASTIGTFLTTNIIGRLLTSVALSALKVALAGKPDSTQAGIRTQQTQTGGITPASFILGKYATEGQLMAPVMSHGQEGKTPNAYLTYVIDLGDIPGQSLSGLILEGELVEFGEEPHADYGTPVLGRFTDHAWIKYHNGTQTEADPMLLDKYGEYPDRPWQADMIGNGITYAILTFRFNREIFSGFPKVRFEMIGIPLYDPRKDSSVGGNGAHRWTDRTTWEPSENAAVQTYNILRGIELPGGHIWGGAADAEDLPLSTWWAEMNKADFDVLLADGSTEPQWRSSYEVFVNDEPATAIEDIMRGCSGKTVESGGIWKIRLGGPGLPLYYFTDDDVILSEAEENTPFSASRDPFNGVQAIYPDPANLWEPKDAPGLFSAAFELEDGGQRRVADLTLPATPYALQVQRVQLAYQLDERRQSQHVLNLPPDANMLEPLDVAAWSSAKNGYDTKSWEIASQIDPLTSGTPQFRLREVDQSDYDWHSTFQLSINYANVNRTPLPPQAVAGFAVSGVAVIDPDGDERRAALQIEWDGDGQDDVRGIQWEIRLAGAEDVLVPDSNADVSAGFDRVTELILPGVEYEVRGQWIVDRPTDWTDWLSATTPDVRLGEKDLADPVWDRIAAEAQASKDEADAAFQLALDERDAISIDDILSRIIEEARVGTEFEEVRETLSVGLDGANAAIEQVKTVAITASEAVAQLSTSLNASIDAVEADLTQTADALATLETSYGSFETAISSQFAALNGYVSSQIYTKSETNLQISSQVNTVQSNVNGLSATVTQVQTAQNGILANHTINVNANGAIASISTMAGGGTSNVIIDADALLVGKSNAQGGFVAPFQVIGSQVYMTRARIGSGIFDSAVIDTLEVRGNAITGSTFGYGGQVGGTGNWENAIVVVVPIKPGYIADAVINWSMEQGYASVGPTWGYRILDQGSVLISREGMTAVLDQPNDQVTRPIATGTRVFTLQWKGSNADISVIRSSMEIRVFYR